jgi:hypothetical protein
LAALWLERDAALAVCSVGALWIVVWLCCPAPVCVCVDRWTVLLSLTALEDDEDELV